MSFILILVYFFVFLKNNNNIYIEKLKVKKEKIVLLSNKPRGKIFDVNGIILVDNITINNIVFEYQDDTDYIETSLLLAKIIDFYTYYSDDDNILWYKARNNINKLLTKNEIKLINERKISNEDKEKIVNERILNITNNYSLYEKKCAKIYKIITNGNKYVPKTILKDINDKIVNKVINSNIKGIKVSISYKRYYPYKDVLNNIFGRVGNITKENKEEYLNKGYDLSDEVGVSYLEKYYDDYLKPIKDKYIVNDKGFLSLLEAGKKGNDLYLSIDINKQIEIEKIVKEALQKAKKYPNTEYLSDTYVILSNPLTGGIISIVGQRLLNNNEFNDVVINNITSSFAMGSVVKGATISVGYANNLIDPNKKVLDSCVKLKNKTEKCSYKSLGYLDSVTALEHSSNYYQFLIAISLCNKKYVPNMDINATEKEFKIYRDMLSSYGLGIKTNIDLPNEQIGIIGKTISDDLLLNLSIGQYDTYTPIELMTYINTIASNGERRSPSFVSTINDNKKIVFQNNYKIIDKVNIKSEDISLIQKGFYYVMNRGTGNGFMNKKVLPAGKTGTSESFIDTNNDNKVDTSILNLTLAGYFPYDNPKYSLIIVSPGAAHNNGNQDYIYYITADIARNITNLFI